MTLRHMKIFVAVCECGNVTAAAEKLFIAQPSVSLAISELENYYGVKLFDRISRKLYLTDVGEKFLAKARHIVDLFDEMEKGVRDWDSFGTLRMGASITIGNCILPALIEEFTKILPDVKVQVVIENSYAIEQKVLSNELDFALIEGITHNDSILFEPFMDDELVCICGKEHPLSSKTEIFPEQLLDCDFILREHGSGTREIFDSAMLIHELPVTPIWESRSTQAIVNAVKAGLGVSVLPYKLVQKEIEAHTIFQFKIRGIDFKRKFYIIYHKNKFISNSAKVFFTICRSGKKLCTAAE